MNDSALYLDNMVDFRQEIKKVMRQRRMSAYQLAKEAGLPMRGVQMFIAGDRDITSERLATLLEVLGFEIKQPRQRKGW